MNICPSGGLAVLAAVLAKVATEAAGIAVMMGAVACLRTNLMRLVS